MPMRLLSWSNIQYLPELICMCVFIVRVCNKYCTGRSNGKVCKYSNYSGILLDSLYYCTHLSNLVPSPYLWSRSLAFCEDCIFRVSKLFTLQRTTVLHTFVTHLPPILPTGDLQDWTQNSFFKSLWRRARPLCSQ